MQLPQTLTKTQNLVFGAGSTTTGISGVEIDSSTLATTATHQSETYFIL